MSEQKMPEPCEFLQAYEDAYAAGIERGRQQGLAEASRLERERLEPLRVALDWMETHVRELCAMTGTPLPQASLDRADTARNLLEQTE